MSQNSQASPSVAVEAEELTTAATSIDTSTPCTENSIENNPTDHSVSINQNMQIIPEEVYINLRAPPVGIMTSDGTEDIPPPRPDFSAPPPYEVATKLPSYEEVQREKTLQGETMPQILPHVHIPGCRVPGQPMILAIDADGVDGDAENRMLGTDFMFFTAFFVAFLFNWIGFLLLMCFCHTIASRYGALAGFGLSLTKWTLIVKHSTDLASRENSWLWWLIMAFGLLICVRAIIQYLNIKRGWRLLSGSAQERLLFYY